MGSIASGNNGYGVQLRYNSSSGLSHVWLNNKMKTAADEVRQYFGSLFRTRPWKARLGVGSFLTLEFGRRIKNHGHVRGEWHLWIYQSNWVLLHGNRELSNSDSDRRVMSASIRRLEEFPLSDVQVEPGRLKTTFLFDDFRLVVSPADYLDEADQRDHYWLLFMPNHEVLTVGPGGIQVEHSETPHYV
jgi:hypothetical protein